MIERVLAGETVVITRSGVPVAELHPLPPQGFDAATLLKRWKGLPSIDPDRFREDIDDLLDSRL